MKLCKILAFAIITAVLLCMAGCGGKSSVSSSALEKEICAEDILSSIDSKNMDKTLYLGDEGFDTNCEKLYYIKPSQLSDGGISYASADGLADEITVLKFSDHTDGEKILQKRVFVRLNTFRSYKPDEVDKINAAEIFKKGDYWVLVISDSAQTIKEFIEDM